MNFNAIPIIEQLEVHQNVIPGLLNNLDDKAVLWKPEKDKWCLLEVALHMVYEEKTDFRARVEYALSAMKTEIPSIDPEGYIEKMDLSGIQMKDVSAEFERERKKSIAYLKTLENPNWENNLIHPQFGEMPARLFLTNWLAHDYLHIRQMTGLRYQYLARTTREDMRYAGDW